MEMDYESINDIRYTDDTVVFANNLSSLQKIANKIVDVSESFKLYLNINKTKYIVILKKITIRKQIFFRRTVNRISSKV
jgi:hypothetical protein